MKQGIFTIIMVSAFVLFGCAQEGVVHDTRLLMNTMVSVKIPTKRPYDVKPIIEKAFSRITEIENLMNRYDKASECAAINRLKAGEVMKVSPETTFVVKRSLELNRLTDGAFDITVSPLVDLWRSYKTKDEIPSKEDIEGIIPSIGSENILLDDKGVLSFAKDSIRIDLSGIAKGYAVDEVIAVLRKNGIEDGLVDAGGDIYCLGSGPDNRPWRIGIKDPRKRGLLGRLSLKDKAVATSGDYENFFIVRGKRYSHIIDPKSGYPVSERPMSVTVVAPDCITADGLATAITVMGPVEGLKLAEGLEGIEAIIISEDNGKLKIDITSGLSNVYEEL